MSGIDEFRAAVNRSLTALTVTDTEARAMAARIMRPSASLRWLRWVSVGTGLLALLFPIPAAAGFPL